MRTLLYAIALLLSACVTTHEYYASTNATKESRAGVPPEIGFHFAFPECRIHDTKTKCVVQYNPGGELEDFVDAVRVFNKNKGVLVVDGLCASGCTITADQLRLTNQVCITKNARFVFHRGITDIEVRNVSLNLSNIFVPSYLLDLREWFAAQGGLPIDPADLLVMVYPQTTHYWKLCP